MDDVKIEGPERLQFTNLTDKEIPAGTPVFMNGLPGDDEILVVTEFNSRDREVVCHPMCAVEAEYKLRMRQAQSMRE